MTSSPRQLLAEAVAWWRVGDFSDRRALADSAASALVLELDSPALRELAGIHAQENPFAVDELIEKVVDELALAEVLGDIDGLATRRLSRWVLSGQMSEREFSGWAHQRFHHEAEDELLNELAALDDELDDTEVSKSGPAETHRKIRELAAAIVLDS